MGLFKKSCWLSPSSPSPNPDPSRWVLLREQRIGACLVAEVRYLDCVNFDGRKIMVFHRIAMLPPKLDPHFRQDYGSPVARFEPTARGWELAMNVAALIDAGEP